MKFKFSNLDIVALLPELNERCKSLRVTNVYNVNLKTYLLKLAKFANDDESKEQNEDVNKNVLLIESGSRIHLTEFDWPKESTPNGFSMKLRKHIKNKRIESIRQLGLDRIIDIQCGIKEAAYHIILELYDKGNILITDHNYVILNLLRPRKSGENEDVKFLVKEIYPIGLKESLKANLLEKSEIQKILDQGKVGDNLKKLFAPKLRIYGPQLLEHCFIENGFEENCKLDQNKSIDIEKIYKSIVMAKSILEDIVNKRGGYIVQKEEDSVVAQNAMNDETKKKIISFIEFNPMIFAQYKNLEKKNQNLVKFDSFNKAIDTFYSNIEGQKIDQRIYQKEKDAFKKLDNIKKDHEKRLQDLEEKQQANNRKGYLIEINNDLVEKALFILRKAISRQMSWQDIKQMLKEAREANDEVASHICSLKLETNHFTMLLDDPYEQQQQSIDSNKNSSSQKSKSSSNQMKVDISLELSAFGNARKYFEDRKFAKKKEDKTIEASSKALKSAQIKTTKALKEVQIKSSIIKSRKVLWFEKFYFFISSENYIVIAGRDAQQNEMIVKKYLKAGDLYVHADLHGASSVVIKNRNPKNKIPSKTIEEAGYFAVCYSSSWENKTPVKAWYVNADQVSKTAPSGEYLTVGSFMIRGKKNYLPLTQLVMGFCFFFRLNEESIPNHVNDRKVKNVENLNEEKEDESITKEEDVEETAFPDTKISLSRSEQDYDMILEAMKPKPKLQRKLKHYKENKSSTTVQTDEKTKTQSNKQTNQQKNKRAKSKGKRNKKEDGWSDEENKIKIKLEKKLEKDNRLVDLENQTRNVNLNYEDSNDEDSKDEDSKDEEVCIDENSEVTNDQKESNEESNQAEVEIPDNEESNDKNKEENDNKNESSDSDSENEKVKYVEESEEEEEEEEEETNDEKKEAEYLKLVNSLTGQPLSNDILMYCLPIVAPYNAIQNCKFKVKVLPGQGKRGRSAKTALQLFLNDKKATNREKDLLRSMKDQDIARNLPNRIKIVAQNLQNKYKK